MKKSMVVNIVHNKIVSKLSKNCQFSFGWYIIETQILKSPLFMGEFEFPYFPKIDAFSTSHEK